MNFNIDDIAKSFAANIALNEARLREAGVQLARVEAEITAKQDEAAQVRESCQQAMQAALRAKSEYEQAANKVKAELHMAQSSLEAVRLAQANEAKGHKDALIALKAQYKIAQKDEQDNIARLAVVRDAIKSEIHSLIAKLKELA